MAADGGSKNLVLIVDTRMGEFESIALSIVGRLASWVAPIPTAVMTARATQQIFELSMFWSGVSSVALELIGVATSNQWLAAHNWNKQKRKRDPKANERLAGLLMGFYFVVDVAMVLLNAISGYQATEDLKQFISLSFPLMSIVGTLVLNERVAQFNREVSVAEAKAKDAEDRKEAKRKQREAEAKAVEVSEAVAVADEFPMYASETWAYYERNPGATFAKASEILGVSDRTISNHVKALAAAGAMRRNGKGWIAIRTNDEEGTA